METRFPRLFYPAISLCKTENESGGCWEGQGRDAGGMQALSQQVAGVFTSKTEKSQMKASKKDNFTKDNHFLPEDTPRNVVDADCYRIGRDIHRPLVLGLHPPSLEPKALLPNGILFR